MLLRPASHRGISIHSPRMGRDLGWISGPARRGDFNPLSPHGERRWLFSSFRVRKRFQSTLPAWGETINIRGRSTAPKISIHSPRMGRDSLTLRHGDVVTDFNPLSPHGERRCCSWPPVGYGEVFQSTLPAWGETRSPRSDRRRDHFNPLSPHGERRTPRPSGRIPRNFNPLSPHGERQQTHTTFRREKLAHLHNIVSFRQQRGSSC